MSMGFSYYGGKVRLAQWIISNFPEHETYIEPFGGGAAVLLQKPVSPVEVYNDREELVTNFFAVLRERFDEFIHKVTWAEKSESMRTWCIDLMQSDFEVPDVDRALCFWWSVNNIVGRNFMRVFTKGNQGGVGGLSFFYNSLSDNIRNKLFAIRERMQNVTIMNRDALELLKGKWVDKPGVLIYLDPPYIGNQEGYRYRFSDEQHKELIALLAGLKHAKWLLSGFDTPLYREAIEQYGWHVMEQDRNAWMRGGASRKVKRGEYKELLIMNYTKSLPLFDI